MADNKDYKVVHETIVPKKHPVRNAIGKFFAVIILAALFGLTERVVYEISGLYIPSVLEAVGIDVKESKVRVNDDGKQENSSGDNKESEKNATPAAIEEVKSDISTESAIKTDETKSDSAASEKSDADKNISESAVVVSENEGAADGDDDEDGNTINGYTELYQGLSDYSDTLNDSIVDVQTVVMGTDWFENPYETEKKTSGCIAAVTGKYAYIVTGYSAIKTGTDIRVTFRSGFTVKATLRNYNKDLDIALLVVKLKDTSDYELKKMKPARFLESHDIKRGSPVIAVGAPDGTIYAVVPGVVTSEGELKYVADRSLRTFKVNIPFSADGTGMIADLKGNVIGMLESGSGDQGIRKIIESADMTDVINSMMNGEGIPYIGIVACEFAGAESTTGRLGGILVDSVAEDSPAADAGIKKGDIIYEIDGRLVSSMDAYQKLLSVKETGDEVRLLIYREKRGEGTEKTIEVVTGDNRGIR